MANPEPTQRLKKELGFFSVFALACGTTLSAGFFLLPGIAVSQAGPAAVLAYLIAAIPLIPATLSIVELATAMPRAGGAYYFVDRSLGPLVGTIGGVGTWLALMLKTSFALIGMGAYLRLFFPGLPIVPVAIALALLFGGLNLYGAKEAGKFQRILVTGLLMLLAWFLTGIRQVDWSNFAGFYDAGAESILATAGLVYISYVGVTKVASVAEEVDDPERNLPRAVFAALGVALFCYVVGTIVMVGVLGVPTLSDSESPMYLAPVAATAKQLFGQTGMVLVTLAAMLAFFSVVNAGILSASRYPFAMSRDRLMPPQLEALSENGIPTLSVLITVGTIVVILLLFDPVKIAKLASAFQLLMFALLCLAVIVMRESRIDSYDPGFRSPLYPGMQLVGILMSLVLISEMGWLSIGFSGGLVLAGSLWFHHYGRARVDRGGALYHVFQRLGERKHGELDAELRGIMAEKGLRAEDPFDDIVARAEIIDVPESVDYAGAAELAAANLARRVPDSAEHIREGFMRTARLGAVAIARGGALPHLRVPDMACSEMVLVRCRSGLVIEHLDDFGEVHAPEELVRALFFFISTEEDPARHLRILAHLAAQLNDDAFMANWLAAENDQQLKEVLLRNERYVSLVIAHGVATGEFAGRRIGDLGLAPGCLVAIVHRDRDAIVPRADTVLEEGDRITIIGDPKKIETLYKRYH